MACFIVALDNGEDLIEEVADLITSTDFGARPSTTSSKRLFRGDGHGA